MPILTETDRADNPPAADRPPRAHPPKTPAAIEASAGRAKASALAARLTAGDWRDWLPDEAPEPPLDELLTRDQLLAQLNDDGVKVTAYDLENWQRTGIIPRGIRRWHRRQDGSGATESFYPRWMADVIRHLRALQGEGFKLAYVGPRLREIAAHDTAHVRVREEATVTKMLTDDDGLLAPAVEAVEAYARRERMTPVAIMFRDKDGFEHAFPLPDAPRSC